VNRTSFCCCRAMLVGNLSVIVTSLCRRQKVPMQRRRTNDLGGEREICALCYRIANEMRQVWKAKRAELNALSP